MSNLKMCASCDVVNNIANKYCDRCGGASFYAGELTCQECGVKYSTKQFTECPNCLTKLCTKFR